MCAQGIGRVAPAGAWLHPLAIVSYLLGGVVMVLIFLGSPSAREPAFIKAMRFNM